MTPYRIILDNLDVECNYQVGVKSYTVDELLKRGDFARETVDGSVKWYHYITEEEFKKYWKPNLFYFITDPVLKIPGTFDLDWSIKFDDIEDLI